MENFFQYYFVRPLFDCSGYNIVNTLGFIILLGIAAFVLKKVFSEKNIKLDEEFFWMLVPYVFFGGVLRSIEDLVEAPLGCASARAANPWLVLFITPFIYFVLAILFLIIFFFAREFTKDHKKTVKFIGWSLVAVSASIVAFNSVYVNEFIIIIAFSLLLSALLFLAFKKTGVYSKTGMIVAYGQLLDASASSIAVGFLGYGEQHVLSTMVMDIHPFLFVPVKMALAFAIVYSLAKDKSKWKWLLFFIVLMIGLAPGLRDALRVLMGV